MGRKGFTLIELLIVIIIIGILAAVGIPVLRGYVDDARYSEADAALGAILTAQRVYHARHNVYTNVAANLKRDGGFNPAEASSRFFNVAGVAYNAAGQGANATFDATISGNNGANDPMNGKTAKIEQDGDLFHNGVQVN